MIKAIVTDIEGTTSAIDFVHKTLFPYAAAKLPDFVRANANTPAVKAVLRETAQIANLDTSHTEALIQQLLDWIAEDKKITPLKTIQGLIWEDGYRQGDYQAHMYQDAVTKLKEWHQQGIPLYVYSSGSIHAQKLFFEFSEAGNLLPLFSGHFDTTTGPKKEAASYQAIQQALNIPATDILFLSDIVEELDAASAAGFQTAWIQREQSLIQKPPHQCLESFSNLDLS
jgi:enolase-phosphatase E1